MENKLEALMEEEFERKCKEAFEQARYYEGKGDAYRAILSSIKSLREKHE